MKNLKVIMFRVTGTALWQTDYGGIGEAQIREEFSRTSTKEAEKEVKNILKNPPHPQVEHPSEYAFLSAKARLDIVRTEFVSEIEFDAQIDKFRKK